VHYVENIRRYYDTLSWIDDKSQQKIEEVIEVPLDGNKKEEVVTSP
jgi:membrane-bound lytic murein transglycosylase MltF